jgi:hypothetical protein
MPGRPGSSDVSIDGSRIAYDVGARDKVHVWRVHWHDVVDPMSPMARSLGELVGWWIEALAAGMHRYDQSARR